MQLALFLQVLRSRWKLALAAWIVTLFTILLTTSLGPWQYSASSAVLVDPKPQDPSSGITTPQTSQIPTEVEVIRSERVARRAITALGLQDHAAWRALWQQRTGGVGDFEAWLSEQLLSRLDIRSSREANVLSVAYTSRDPDTSASLANAFTQAYLEVSLDLRQEPAREYSAYFAETAKGLRAKLELAQARRARFQQQNGLLARSGGLDTEMLHLAELNSQVLSLQTAAASAASRQRQTRGQGGGMEEVLRDPVVIALTSELSRQQARLAELRTRLGEQHPVVIELRDGNEELRSRISAASRRATSTLATEDRVASERLVQARAALAAQRAKVLAITSLQDEQAVLDKEVDSAQRAYDAALNRFSQTSLESGGARRNVSVLKRATRPVLPSWPNIPLVLGAGMVMGLIVALFAVFLGERADRRLRTIDSIGVELGMRVVGLLEDTSATMARQARIPAA